MKIFLLLITTVAFTKGKVKTEPECSSVRPGRYCNEDLSGFKICGENGGMGSSSCDSHYRCSCGFNNRCEEDAKCVRKPKFTDSEIPSNFIVSFNGIRKFTNPTFFQNQTLNGVILQDTTPGDEKFAMRTNFTNNLRIGNLQVGSFVQLVDIVIRKDTSGNFVEVRFK